MDRRSLLKLTAAISLYSAGWPLVATASKRSETPQNFDFQWLEQQAETLSARAYHKRNSRLPASVEALSWDDYQQLRFDPDRALWADHNSRFRAQFFHLGLYFKKPVRLHEVVNGQVRELAYNPDHFRYRGEQPLENLPNDLGYAGFRLHFHNDFRRDMVAFLGASYFRAVGETMQYGLSARGLAVDTGLSRPEEFPDFTEFWFERPDKSSGRLRVYALLDSPSISGAYRFDIEPGTDTVMDVIATLFPRKNIERIGIAPLTSMYQMGENDRRMANDWRPEIHDSDGLALWTGSGEWIWRPLVNPQRVMVNSFSDNNPRGFGLLQRDRNFNHYQDDGVFYEQRPGLWVEPGEDWGKGVVMLVEIPTVDETFDNIVAFWNPERPLPPGQAHRLSYRLTWGNTPPATPELATTRATRTGIGGVVGQPRNYFSWRFAVDFAGGALATLAEDAPVEAVISASRGNVEITSARPLDAINGYRAMFDLVPDASEAPIDLRLYLRLAGEALSETWLYQYTPPPLNERSDDSGV